MCAKSSRLLISSMLPHIFIELAFAKFNLLSTTDNKRRIIRYRWTMDLNKKNPQYNKSALRRNYLSAESVKFGCRIIAAQHRRKHRKVTAYRSKKWCWRSAWKSLPNKALLPLFKYSRCTKVRKVLFMSNWDVFHDYRYFSRKLSCKICVFLDNTLQD